MSNFAVITVPTEGAALSGVGMSTVTVNSLGIPQANERCRYNVTMSTSLIGWAHT